MKRLKTLECTSHNRTVIRWYCVRRCISRPPRAFLEERLLDNQVLRVPIPNDTSLESSRRDVSTSTFLAPTLCQPWRYRVQKIGPGGCHTPSYTVGADVLPQWLVLLCFVWALPYDTRVRVCFISFFHDKFAAKPKLLLLSWATVGGCTFEPNLCISQ